MGTQGDIYERELKHLLSGDQAVIDKVTKTCTEEEAAGYRSLLSHPFMVVRAAGSHGVDLIALRWDFSFPIEVKSSADFVLHFSRNPRLGEQAENMAAECARSQLLPIYAFRLKKSGGNVKGDPWRLFILPVEDRLRGPAGLLQRRIPCMYRGPSGNLIMKWDEGMKLSEFLSYANMSTQ